LPIRGGIGQLRRLPLFGTRGWMEGYPDGTFQPDRPLTRAESVTVLNRVLGRPAAAHAAQASWPDVPATFWAFADIEAASQTFVYRP